MVSKQVTNLWRERTGTGSPDEWSRKHSLPSECLLALNDAKSIIDAIANPGEVSSERLHYVYAELEKEGALVDLETASAAFLRRVLPARYQKIGFSVDELSEWLCRKLGDAPDRWLTDGGLHKAVEAFVMKRYETHTRDQAAKKVKMLSDADAKILLLKLIAEFH